MRKYLYMLLVFGLVGQVFALDPVNFEIIQRFSNGDGRGEFEYLIVTTEGSGLEPRWPYGLIVSEEVFYVDDYRNNRIVEFSLDLRVWREIPVFPSGQSLLKNDRFMLTVDAQSNFSIINYREGQKIGSGRFVSNSQISGYMATRSGFGYRSMVLAGDVLFAQARESNSGPQYHSFLIPGGFDGRFEYLNPEETIRYLKEDYKGTEEFSVDEDGYIFWNGRLVAPYGYSYARYHWNTNRPTTEWQATILFSQFIGWDRDGNTHWSDHRKISVLNPQGETLAFFEASNVADTSRSQFTVTPEGTLYVLSYNRDLNEFELMKLERFW